MKTVSKILLYAACLLFLFGCQKDEQTKEPDYRLTMHDNAGEFETRSGGHQFVFFSQSMTVVHTLSNLYPQYVFNRGLVDSVVLVKILPEIDAYINNGGNGSYCFLYRVTIYNSTVDPVYFLCYAKSQFGDRFTFIPAGTSWNNNIAYAEMTRNLNVYQEYFDLACQQTRRNYSYWITYVTEDESYTENLILAGNNGCGDLYMFKTSW